MTIIHSVFKFKFLLVFALFCFSQLTIAQQSNDAYKMMIEADSIFIQGELSKAYQLYAEADSIYTSQKDFENSCLCKYGILYAQLKMGEAKSVIEGIEEALAFCNQKIKSPHISVGKLMYLNGIVENHLRNGDYTKDKAFAAVEYLIPLVGESDITIANLYNLIGISFYNDKDYYKALEFYQKSLDIKVNINGENHYSLGTTLNNMGIIYQFLDDTPKAISYFEKSLKIKIKKYGPNHMRISNTKFNIAQQYINLGSYDKALKYLKEVIEIDKNQEELKDFKLAHRLSELSELYLLMGNSELAIKTGEESIAYYKQANLNPVYPATGYQSLGSVYRDLGDHENALKNYQESLTTLTGEPLDDLFDNPIINSWNISDRIYQTLFKKAGTLNEWYEATQNVDFLKHSLSTYEKVLDVMAQIQINIETLNSNYTVLEDSRFVFEAALKINYKLYEITNDDFYIDKALKIDNLSKAFLLRKSVKASLIKGLTAVPDSIIKKMKALKTDIISSTLLSYEDNGKEPEALKQEYLELENGVIAKYPSYSLLKYDNKIDLNAIQDGLTASNESVVSWFLGEQKGFGIVLDGQNKQIFNFEINDSLVGAIKALSKMISNYTIAVSKSNSLAIFNQFGDLSRSIANTILPSDIVLKEDLVLVPDGILSLIPLELLLTDDIVEQDKVDYSKLPYLIVNHNIRYASSIVDVISDNNPTEIHQILAVAPSYEGEQTQLLASRSGFSDLAFTVKEVEQIAAIFKTKILQGKTALKESFLESIESNGLIHLAMHAFSDDENPDMSGLVFARANYPDTSQILYGHEISELDLNAELVVLSACNTGTGKIVSGEGSLSLARSFKQAGCSNVIMSLWQADDESTSLIMGDFYQGLKEGKGKAVALKDAKLTYLANNRKQFPYFWSTFILSGDNNAVSFEAKINYSLWGIGALILGFLGYGLMRGRKEKGLA